MKNEDKAELLAGTYQRQYHHNTYPELSNNSEFVTSKEEIKEACKEMAEWKEQQMIEKALNWIHDNLCYYDEDGFDADGNGILGDFKKAMEEE